MVNFCANPDCGKPLHYLREGRVFVFPSLGVSEPTDHSLEHFWLCGACAESKTLMRDAGGTVKTVAKLPDICNPKDTAE